MSAWDSAVWGVDRWPALSVADALQQKPRDTHGHPIGVGDWRVSVEVMLPSDPLAVWGVGTWGSALWPANTWYDLTPWVRGVEWERGSDEPYGRPRVGSLSMTLDSRNDEFSPWSTPSNILLDDDDEPLTDDDGNVLTSVGRLSPGYTTPSWWSPGTLVRVGVHSPTDTRAGGWLPQFCGIVDSWEPDYVEANLADRFVSVTAVETLRDLAQIDDNALASPVGSGENPVQRFERLLDAANWQYGFNVEAQNLIFSPGFYSLQSTDMAMNRLAECYRVADACDVNFRTDRKGAAIAESVRYVGNVGDADVTYWPMMDFSFAGATWDAPWVGFFRYGSKGVNVQYLSMRPDSFKSSTQDQNVVNDCRFARVGGTQQTFEEAASIVRYGRRTLVRNDFINSTDTPVASIAEYTANRRALNSLRVENITVDLDRQSDDRALTTLAIDVGVNAFVYSPGVVDFGDFPYITTIVRKMSHRVTPRNTGEVTWESSFGFDTRTVVNVPGAQLPSSS